MDAKTLSTVAGVLIGALLALPAHSQEPAKNGGDSFDPSKVVGSMACQKCHPAEVRTWEGTPHCLCYDELHRKPEAKAITDRLGLRSVKRNDTCVRCHYTRKEEGGRVRVDSGVSCESCHGPALDWIEVHAEYGPGVTRQTESPDHRAQRRDAAIALGMNNPSNVYLIARQCLDCHTTPNEDLVDIGQHPAGSANFDFVAWSQGMVRHNFVRSDGVTNEPSGPERLRVMHVVGVMADLEYSLRAVSEVSGAGLFAKTAAERAARRKQALWDLQRRLDHPLLLPALAAVSEVELKLGNGDAIRAAADAVGEAAYSFARDADGAQLAAVDALLPTAAQYK
ncbi:MAG: cytochrome c family protein [Lacipirellulaceae bacterium]